MGTKNQERDKLNNCLDVFTGGMRHKLFQKVDRGFTGWDDVRLLPALKKSLMDHAMRVFMGEAGQEEDVANIAMFIKFLEDA